MEHRVEQQSEDQPSLCIKHCGFYGEEWAAWAGLLVDRPRLT